MRHCLRRVSALLALLIALVAFDLGAARALDLGKGGLPLAFTSDGTAVFTDADEIIVEGTVNDATPAAIALRVDDAASTAYATRYNDERKIPPGPFRFTVGVKGLKTPSGRVLDRATIARIVVFAWEGTPNVSITRFEMARGAMLPERARGYAFGALDAALPPGFERIGPADSRVTGAGGIQVVRRPAPDPLVANGLKGVRRIVLPAAGSRMRVTVWSEDPGEWEALPHPFERRILVNGRVLVDEKRSADQWIAERYLRGSSAEHTARDDAWTAYGRLRGNPAALDVDAINGEVVIELAGGEPSALFVNAVLIEPHDASTPPLSPTQPTTAQAFVNGQRARWYRERFPVAAVQPSDDAATTIMLTRDGPAQLPPLTLRAAPDTGSRVSLQIAADTTIARPQITLTPPRRGSVALAARLWAAQRTLERDDSVLRLRDNRLRADAASLAITPDLPRGYELWIDIPKATPPGIYTGALAIATPAGSRTVPLDVTVLAVTLPSAKPAGTYLARPAHLAYFAGLTLERERQVACDLDLLRGFGLANTAPPIGGLDRTDLGLFATEMRRAQASGVAAGWLIYNPLDDLVQAQGRARAAATVGRLTELIAAQGLPPPLWSVADEPSNPDQHAGPLADWVAQLRAKAPAARLGGHLNTPIDSAFVPLFDTVIVNPGFGIDLADLDRLKAAKKGVWLYNTSAPRQTAGLWLWRTSADRYVQWHARMPTADPFDPLDGREADYQMIYPTFEICPRQPDIHRDLLRLAEGVVDQRWLTWLAGQTTPAARNLSAGIKASFSGRFVDARNQSRAQLEALRGRIMDMVAP